MGSQIPESRYIPPREINHTNGMDNEKDNSGGIGDDDGAYVGKCASGR
ncbi:hypothetical protein GCM10009132_30050 [Serratia ureilytica]